MQSSGQSRETNSMMVSDILQVEKSKNIAPFIANFNADSVGLNEQMQCGQSLQCATGCPGSRELLSSSKEAALIKLESLVNGPRPRLSKQSVHCQRFQSFHHACRPEYRFHSRTQIII